MSPANAGKGTPESDYSRPTVRGKGMRTGYTTGACAAADRSASNRAKTSASESKKVPLNDPRYSFTDLDSNSMGEVAGTSN